MTPILRFPVPAREEASGPPLIGIILLYVSLWAVWGLASWATDDIGVGALVALVYAFGLTVYLDHIW